MDNSSPAPGSESPHETRYSHGMTPTDTETETAPETAPDVARPTHRLRNIQCGSNGVQLLVSTRDHLYDADDVEAGEGTWQVIGAWSDESAPELTKVLNQRSYMSNSSRPATRAQPSSQSNFDRSGHRLGGTVAQPGGVSN